MKLSELIKMIFRQPDKSEQIELAFKKGNNKLTEKLIKDIIGDILFTRLTKEEFLKSAEFYRKNKDWMERKLIDAFKRGWMRSGAPNLPDARDEVVQELKNILEDLE